MKPAESTGISANPHLSNISRSIDNPYLDILGNKRLYFVSFFVCLSCELSLVCIHFFLFISLPLSSSFILKVLNNGKFAGRDMLFIVCHKISFHLFASINLVSNHIAVTCFTVQYEGKMNQLTTQVIYH